MPKFLKRPVVIDAIQWTGSNEDEIKSFVGSHFTFNPVHNSFYLRTLEGMVQVSEGDWIIRGITGEYYSCNPEVFSITYEELAQRDPYVTQEPSRIPSRISIAPRATEPEPEPESVPEPVPDDGEAGVR